MPNPLFCTTKVNKISKKQLINSKYTPIKWSSMLYCAISLAEISILPRNSLKISKSSSMSPSILISANLKMQSSLKPLLLKNKKFCPTKTNFHSFCPLSRSISTLKRPKSSLNFAFHFQKYNRQRFSQFLTKNCSKHYHFLVSKANHKHLGLSRKITSSSSPKRYRMPLVLISMTQSIQTAQQSSSIWRILELSKTIGSRPNPMTEVQCFPKER